MRKNNRPCVPINLRRLSINKEIERNISETEGENGSVELSVNESKKKNITITASASDLKSFEMDKYLIHKGLVQRV